MPIIALFNGNWPTSNICSYTYLGDLPVLRADNPVVLGVSDLEREALPAEGMAAPREYVRSVAAVELLVTLFAERELHRINYKYFAAVIYRSICQVVLILKFEFELYISDVLDS
jgi:hypothetical protein